MERVNGLEPSVILRWQGSAVASVPHPQMMLCRPERLFVRELSINSFRTEINRFCRYSSMHLSSKITSGTAV